MNPIQDPSIILYHIYPQLSLIDAYQLSLTNHLFNNLFHKAIREKLILKLSPNFIFKLKNNINTQYCKIIEYSITKNTIKYRFISYGRYENITWPIITRKTLYLSMEVHHPQFVTPQLSSLSHFLSNWERISDNSHYIYSIEYIHPLFFASLQRSMYFMYIFFFLSIVFTILFLTFLGVRVILFPTPSFYEDESPLIFYNNDLPFCTNPHINDTLLSVYIN